MYVSNTPWTEGLTAPFPPGENKYINSDIHKAAFALPEFFRKELYE
jgi:spermidine synthase